MNDLLKTLLAHDIELTEKEGQPLTVKQRLDKFILAVADGETPDNDMLRFIAEALSKIDVDTDNAELGKQFKSAFGLKQKKGRGNSKTGLQDWEKEAFRLNLEEKLSPAKISRKLMEPPWRLEKDNPTIKRLLATKKFEYECLPFARYKKKRQEQWKRLCNELITKRVEDTPDDAEQLLQLIPSLDDAASEYEIGENVIVPLVGIITGGDDKDFILKRLPPQYIAPLLRALIKNEINVKSKK